MTDSLPQVTLPNGERVPAFGQGTWHMGDDRRRAAEEVAAVRLGIDLGMTLIDTAEMYGSGGAEEIVADAAQGQRERLFIVSKVLPYNASQKGVIEACERSLRRLRTDRIDLYLLHWRGDVPLRETIAGFAELLRMGKIRHAGVSNFDVGDLEELADRQDGVRVATDQVLYNLERRGIEWELLGWCRRRHRPVMAYSPLEEGLLSHRDHPALARVAACHDPTAAQVSLAWLIRQTGVIAIPKARHAARVRENRGSVELRLTKRDLDELDDSFPPPPGPMPLETR